MQQILQELSITSADIKPHIGLIIPDLIAPLELATLLISTTPTSDNVFTINWVIIAYSRQNNLGNYFSTRKITPFCILSSTNNGGDEQDTFNPNPPL
jgi:hypothetical protein